MNHDFVMGAWVPLAVSKENKGADEGTAELA